MATVTAVSGGGSWNANTTWVGSVQPTAADDVVLPSMSFAATIPAGVTALCRSLTVQSGGKLGFGSTTAVLNIGDGSGGALSIDAGAMITLTGVGTINFVATSDNGGVGWPITVGGKTLPNVTFNGAGGKWKLQDALNGGTTATLTLTTGNLDGNAKAVTIGKFVGNGTLTRALTTGIATWTLTGTSGTVWNLSNVTNLTLNLAGATLAFTGNAAVTVNVGAADLGAANLTFGPGATAAYTLTGAFTNAGTLTVTGPASVSLAAGAGTNKTVARILLNGSAGNIATFNSSTPGSVAGVKLGAAASTATYATLTDITCNPGASIDARGGTNTDGGNNHNVIFVQPKRAALLGVT